MEKYASSYFALLVLPIQHYTFQIRFASLKYHGGLFTYLFEHPIGTLDKDTSESQLRCPCSAPFPRSLRFALTSDQHGTLKQYVLLCYLFLLKHVTYAIVSQAFATSFSVFFFFESYCIQAK